MRTIARLLPAILLFAPTVAFAQTDEPPAAQAAPISGGGTEVLRYLLDDAGIKPITFFEANNGIDNYKDAIVIVLGEPPSGRNRLKLFAHAQNAINGGGAALIASDRPLNYVLERRSVISIEEASVECSNLRAVHKEMMYCPYVVSPKPRFGGNPLNPVSPVTKVFSGLARIATNKPSILHVHSAFVAETRFPLATLPADSVILDDQTGRSRPIGGLDLFAVGGDETGGGKPFSYRFLMMADHSVFINQMLIESNTDNLEFTRRVIAFLQEWPNGVKRTRCLFIVDGQVIERFDDLRQILYPPMPRPPLPPLPLDKLTDLGNQLIDKAQEKNLLNNMLLGSDQEPEKQAARLASIVKWLLVAAGIAATLFLLKRAFAARKPSDLPHAPGVAGAAIGPPGVFDRRQKELLRRDNVYESIRDLLRDFFGSVGVHGEPGPRLPQVAISKVVRKPDSLRGAIADFWKIAFGKPTELSVNRWRELEPYFERVRQAHADGKWYFVFEEATAGSVE